MGRLIRLDKQPHSMNRTDIRIFEIFYVLVSNTKNIEILPGMRFGYVFLIVSCDAFNFLLCWGVYTCFMDNLSDDDVDELFDGLKDEMRSDRLWVLRTTVAIILIVVLTTVLMVVL